MDTFTDAQEAAILRTLRDIECGHIILRCHIRRYDEHTGRRLPDPVLVETTSDRAPPGGYPRRGPRPWECWWNLLAERGWIRIAAEHEPDCWQVTDVGRAALTNETRRRRDG